MLDGGMQAAISARVSSMGGGKKRKITKSERLSNNRSHGKWKKTCMRDVLCFLLHMRNGSVLLALMYIHS